MPYPGEVFYLPPELGEDPGKGDRPHVLLSPWQANQPLVTLAYGSTQSTDARHGAEHVLVDPAETSYGGIGLVHPTYVYTSRLVCYPAAALPPYAGRIIDEMPEIRASLGRALGLGSGATHEPNARGTNRRGRVVELTADLAEEWDLHHAVVVTASRYSRNGFQQLVVPLLDGRYEADASDIILSDEAWFARIGDRFGAAILATSMVSTVYGPVQIARFLEVVVPAYVMDRLDQSLTRHFDL